MKESCDTPGFDFKLLEGVRFPNTFYRACQNQNKKIFSVIFWVQKKERLDFGIKNLRHVKDCELKPVQLIRFLYIVDITCQIKKYRIVDLTYSEKKNISLCQIFNRNVLQRVKFLNWINKSGMILIREKFYPSNFDFKLSEGVRLWNIFFRACQNRKWKISHVVGFWIEKNERLDFEMKNWRNVRDFERKPRQRVSFWVEKNRTVRLW